MVMKDRDANSVNPDCSHSDIGLHCLLRFIHLKT